MNSKRVLLVEDNPDDIALAQAAFAKVAPEHRLIVVDTAEAALTFLLTSDVAGADLPAVVLLDLKLSGLDGFEVLRRVRTSGSHAALVPVVVLTSSLEERDIQMSYALGANSYLRKPVDYDDFLSLTQQIIRYWLTCNQPLPPQVAQ